MVLAAMEGKGGGAFRAMRARRGRVLERDEKNARMPIPAHRERRQALLHYFTSMRFRRRRTRSNSLSSHPLP